MRVSSALDHFGTNPKIITTRWRCAVSVDDDQGWLAGDGEVCVDLAGVVADRGKGEAVSGDEVIECVVVACPCDSDELDFAVPLLVGRFDRSGFLFAGASSGCPKPEYGRSHGEHGAVELGTGCKGFGELQQVRPRTVRGARSVVSTCVSRWRGGSALLSDESGDDVKHRNGGSKGGNADAGFLDLVDELGDVENGEDRSERDGCKQ